MPPAWWLTRDGDVACLALYERHYSAERRNDERGPRTAGFGGPGERVVLRTEDATALWVWKKDVRTADNARTRFNGEEGVMCGVFRNESQWWRSSDLIRQADAIADCLWADRRHYTYVNAARVASGLPGACFLSAGWRYVRAGGHRVRTKSGLLILERVR